MNLPLQQVFNTFLLESLAALALSLGFLAVLTLLLWGLLEVLGRLIRTGRNWERIVSYLRNREDFLRWRAEKRVKKLRSIENYSK